jgi:hypothetical protein
MRTPPILFRGTSANCSAKRAKIAKVAQCREAFAHQYRAVTLITRNRRFTVDLLGTCPRHSKSEFLSRTLFPENQIMQKQLNRLPFLAIIIATLTLTLSHVGGANIAPAKPHVKKIFGRIQYVTAFPDYKVEVVSALEDLRVQEVTALANSAGKWQIVTALPDFKIQKVTAFADFKISFVNALPGTP